MPSVVMLGDSLLALVMGHRRHGEGARARALEPERPKFKFCLCHVQSSVALGKPTHVSSGFLVSKVEPFIRTGHPLLLSVQGSHYCHSLRGSNCCITAVILYNSYEAARLIR